MFGEDADWWVLGRASSGWYCYKASTDSWKPGICVGHQGPLFNLSPYEVLNMTGLPAGLYTFYFGVDLNMNGSVDCDQISCDFVEVEIAPQ